MSTNGSVKLRPRHYVSAPEQIKGVQLKLKQLGIRGKSVLKDEKTHLFVEGSDGAGNPSVADIESKLGPDWKNCSECDLCSKPNKSGSKRKYVVYPPMILSPTGSTIETLTAEKSSAENSGCTHVAINAQIPTGDHVRRPEIEPVIGDFGPFVQTSQPSKEDYERAFWATSVQNGIYQTWAPLYTMFSRGNVTEKKRVLDTFKTQVPIESSTVIDSYSGIGYFSFPYAKQNPHILYCWEINPWSVEGMLRAAKVNKIPCRAVFPGDIYGPQANDKIVIFVEDNQNASQRLNTLDLRNVSHINMGSSPHARDAIPVALASGSRSRPAIHLHENVNSRNFDSWKAEMSQTLGRECVHLEQIKQFSPGVYHVCGDFL